jgi:hypothetical protein
MSTIRTTAGNTLVRIAVSVPTLGAVAAVVGAGWKWV